MTEETSKPKKTQMAHAEFNAADSNCNHVTKSSNMDGHRPQLPPPIVNPPTSRIAHLTICHLQVKWPEGCTAPGQGGGAVRSYPGIHGTSC